MKTIKMLFVALTVVSALTAVSATAASAHEWKLLGMALTKSMSAKQTPTYHFADRTNSAEFDCTLEENGTAGTGGLGQITSVKEVECKRDRLCQTNPTIEAKNLPWNTELTTYEGKLVNRITSASPTWKWKCQVLGTEWTETCGVATTMFTKNIGEGVEEFYKNEKEIAVTECSNSSGFWVEGKGVLREPKFGEPYQAF
jgi:hypothetical protein